MSIYKNEQERIFYRMCSVLWMLNSAIRWLYGMPVKDKNNVSKYTGISEIPFELFQLLVNLS